MLYVSLVNEANIWEHLLETEKTSIAASSIPSPPAHLYPRGETLFATGAPEIENGQGATAPNSHSDPSSVNISNHGFKDEVQLPPPRMPSTKARLPQGISCDLPPDQFEATINQEIETLLSCSKNHKVNYTKLANLDQEYVKLFPK